jgi:signal transduction histidine kinase
LFRRLILPLLLASHLAAAAEPAIDTIAKVRALPPEAAARQLPVRLDATVIFFDHNSSQTSLFVQDNTACTYVAPIHLSGTYSCMNLEPGSRVRIEGFTNEGRFFPIIWEKRIELLGKGPLPEPRRISEDELLSPALDSQWVEVPAVVTGVQSDRYMFTLAVDVHGWKLKARLPRDERSYEKAAALMNRPVRLHGIVGIIGNPERQMTGIYFFVPSLDQLIPTDTPAASVTPSLRAATELLRNSDTPSTLVRVAGVVTQVDGNDFYLRDARGSMLVRAAQKIEIAPGDQVEAEGFAAMASYRPVLRARKVTVTGRTDLPQPIPIDFTPAKLPYYHDEFVMLDAELLARNKGTTESVLQCRVDDWFFEALLPPDAPLPKGLTPGDRVQLAGICELTTTHPISFDWTVDGFRLHLPKTGGVVILSHAPWWTLRHLLFALGILGAVAFVAIVWVVLLRYRVKAQTEIIGTKIKQAGVHEERQRIARELHDSVEQGLASLSMHLGGISDEIEETPTGVPAPIRTSVQLAQKMLHHCRLDARASIRDLRNIELEQRGLPGALRELLPGAMAGCGATFQIEVAGEPRPIDAMAENHLLRLAQEGVANAAKHAAAGNIAVDLDYKPESVTMTIHDDGCGFDPAAPVLDGHFGLRGIRERANKLQAAIAIDSAPGKGTTIRVVVPSLNNHKE